MTGHVTGGTLRCARPCRDDAFGSAEATTDDIARFGHFDNNAYASVIGPVRVFQEYPDWANPAERNDYAAASRNWHYLSIDLPTWQTMWGKDIQSRLGGVQCPAGTDLRAKVRFEYNASHRPKTMSLDGSYPDARNVVYSNTVVVPPFGSVVLMQK